MALRMISFGICKILVHMGKSVYPTVVGYNILYELIRSSLYIVVFKSWIFLSFFFPLLVISVTERHIKSSIMTFGVPICL